jgi:hypothetical protein
MQKESMLRLRFGVTISSRGIVKRVPENSGAHISQNSMLSFDVEI